MGLWSGQDELQITFSWIANDRQVSERRVLPCHSQICLIFFIAGHDPFFNSAILVGIDGSEVEKYFHDWRVKVIAAYCESDVVNTESR